MSTSSFGNTNVPDFTTAQMVSNRLSKVGLGLRIDHDPQNAAGEAISAATADVYYYLATRYTDLVGLSNNRWVQSITTLRTIIYLCSWRNNPVPKWLTDEWEVITKQLTDVQMGKTNVPGMSLGLARLPQAIHVRVDYGAYPSIRVTRIGTTNNPKGYTRRMDRTEPPPGGGIW